MFKVKLDSGMNPTMKLKARARGYFLEDFKGPFRHSFFKKGSQALPAGCRHSACSLLYKIQHHSSCAVL